MQSRCLVLPQPNAVILSARRNLNWVQANGVGGWACCVFLGRPIKGESNEGRSHLAGTLRGGLYWDLGLQLLPEANNRAGRREVSLRGLRGGVDMEPWSDTLAIDAQLRGRGES